MHLSKLPNPLTGKKRKSLDSTGFRFGVNLDSLIVNVQFLLWLSEVWKWKMACTYIEFQSILPYRHLCHGWHGPSVRERLWFSRAQHLWAGNRAVHDQAEALGLSQAWRSHWQRVQHRPRSSSKNICTQFVGWANWKRPDRSVQPKSPLLSLDLFKALLALGSPVEPCDASMEAMRTGIRSGTYHNPMASSQILPALQQKSYLAVKNKDCLNEDGMCSAVSPPCGQFRWL